MILSEEKILNKAQKKAYYFVNNFKQKLIALQYPHANSEKIASLDVAIFDIYECLCTIYQYYLPIIIDKKNLNKDDLQDKFIALQMEFDDIKHHIEDIGDNIMLISNFLDEDNDKNDVKDNKTAKREPRKWLKLPKIFRK